MHQLQVVASLVAGLAAGSALAAGSTALGTAMQKTETDSTSYSKSTTDNYSETYGETKGTNQSQSNTSTDTKSLTRGTLENVQLTRQNKSIINILERIDRQLKRLDECESVGMWESEAYFLSEDLGTCEMAASMYKALMKGVDSGVEVSAVNYWGDKHSNDKIKTLKNYVTNFMPPVFIYPSKNGSIPITPCSLVSSNELAIHMGLPRKSVCGFPVIEHADFAKEIVWYDSNINSNTINLGKIFNMGVESENNVKLNRNSLTMHTFITGSTGSGKSNTIYAIPR